MAASFSGVISSKADKTILLDRDVVDNLDVVGEKAFAVDERSATTETPSTRRHLDEIIMLVAFEVDGVMMAFRAFWLRKR